MALSLSERHLGKEANEDFVKKTDLSGFKIVAFATHGLVPGELFGLDQPALALSAPDVAGIQGDGLLTMQEILSLKLDADWVVLSACNTGAGAGAGAEAASGLGRAFFYAGTRAILVSNWSVHSQSARELVTDLFRRQAADAKLSRGAALQQAMMALMDGKGFTDEKGTSLFSYAHLGLTTVGFYPSLIVRGDSTTVAHLCVARRSTGPPSKVSEAILSLRLDPLADIDSLTLAIGF
jgi:CHAT domain-containing protein